MAGQLEIREVFELEDGQIVKYIKNLDEYSFEEEYNVSFIRICYLKVKSNVFVLNLKIMKLCLEVTNLLDITIILISKVLIINTISAQRNPAMHFELNRKWIKIN